MIETYNIKDINIILKNVYKRWDSKLFFKYVKEYKLPLKKEIRKLSTGMKKKLEIITAICHHPKVLILDEPTSGLDPVIRSEVLDMFQDFVDGNDNSILLSTHITSDLEHIADNVIFISKGEIIFDRPLKEIQDDYIVLDVDKKEIDNIDKKHIIKTKENRLDYQVLIHKKNMSKKYDKYIKHITSLDDIMLLYIRGV
jgi:ABC-2 type transport system ATP-binding protein